MLHKIFGYHGNWYLIPPGIILVVMGAYLVPLTPWGWLVLGLAMLCGIAS